MQLKDTDLLDIYELMLLIRTSELKMIELFKKGEIAGHMLPCAGQEAIPATFSKLIKEEDFLLTGHRGGGHYIARGCSFDQLWAELHGRVAGITRGRGGQIHLIDMSKNAITGNAVVGAQWGLAAGAGFAARRKKVMTFCFGGEGSTNRGPFHESLNMAAVQNLPILFVIENNGRQMWNTSDETIAVEHIAVRAMAYGLKGVTIDGDDPEAIYKAPSTMIEEIKATGKPSMLECVTHKWSDSVSNVRQSQEDVDNIKSPEIDCVLRLENKLRDRNALDDAGDKEIKARNANKLAAAIDFAQKSEWPDPKDGLDQVYSQPC